jgi:hypothetical protein
MVKLVNPGVLPESRLAEMSPDRAIRYLENWHRTWEIVNPDKIAGPTFATERDLNHRHVWHLDTSKFHPRLIDRWFCRVCQANTFDDPHATEETA